MQIRFTIDMAATAASPYTPACPFNIIVVTLVNPCRIRLGRPVLQIMSTSFGSLVTYRSASRLCVLLLENI